MLSALLGTEHMTLKQTSGLQRSFSKVWNDDVKSLEVPSDIVLTLDCSVNERNSAFTPHNNDACAPFQL